MTHDRNLMTHDRNLITCENLECGICYTNYSLLNFIEWRNCTHYKECCPDCTNIWRIRCLENNLPPSCPLCRKYI